MECEISVIVPIYNSEKYLNKCIDSILKQSFENIELILVNDGSSDLSGEICEQYKLKDNRIKVIHIKNSGVSQARNIGIKYAKGKYIMFADSDDYVDKYWCESLYKRITKNNELFVMCGYKIINQRKNYHKIEKVIFNQLEEETLIDKKDFYLLITKKLFNSPCNKIFVKDLINKNNIKYESEISLGEDMLFNLDYLNLNIENIVIVNRSLYNYVKDEKESLDYKFYSNMYEICKYRYKRVHDFMINNDINMSIYEIEYYKRYFFELERTLKNTFHKNNKLSFRKKIDFNSRILKSEDMKNCISHLSSNEIRRSYLKVLKSENYFLVIVYLKIINTLHNIKMKLQNI